jgi:ribosome-associated toxin RatA of RatAB toxin-antitoxin module
MFKCEKVGINFFDNAPHCFTAQEVVPATPSQVFSIFEDPHSWTVWADVIQSVEWTSPKPYRLGTTRRVYMKGAMIADEEFIAWERGKRMAFCFTKFSQNKVTSFAEDYQVTDLKNGTCNVQWRMAMAPKGFSKVLLMIASPLMKMFVRRAFRSFRQYVEQQRLASDANVME